MCLIMKKQIKIKYHDDSLEKICKLDIGDWIDLRASEDITVPLGTQALIPLGISMELPEGYEALVAPRSSTFKNYGMIVVNSPGIIDNSYRGMWYLSVFALGKTSEIKKNDRICQFRILNTQPHLDFVEIQELSATERANGGFGSTGL